MGNKVDLCEGKSRRHLQDILSDGGGSKERLGTVQLFAVFGQTFPKMFFFLSEFRAVRRIIML